MKMRKITAILLTVALLCIAAAASAASYSKVYGQTQDKLRVRKSASTSATVIDGIQKGAAVYVVSSKTSGSNVYLQVKYRGYEGYVLTGWLCQTDGSTTYVKILSSSQAQTTFKVSGGNLPNKRVGTWTTAQRTAAGGSAGTTSSTSAATIKEVQTKLKALGYYTGEVTGNAGEKTVAAIKAFQKKYGLTADGIPGTNTLSKLNTVYSSSSSTSTSGSTLKNGSSGSSVTTLQENLTALGYYSGDITGYYGSMTAAAVKKFQKAKGLTQTGEADSATQKAISNAVTGSSTTSGTTTVSLYALVSKNNANMRTGHSTSSSSKVSMEKDMPVKITKKYAGNGEVWYYGSVSMNGYRYSGWISSTVLTLITYSEYKKATGSDNSSSLGIIKVTSDIIAIREGPSTSSAKVGTANTGDTFYYTAHENGWYQLKNGNYIKDNYCTVIE